MIAKNKWTLLTGLLLSLALMVNSATPKAETRSFSAKKELKLDLVSGDCVIRVKSGAKIEVKVSYSYAQGEYTPEFEDLGDTLRLGEDFSNGSCSGSSSWDITLPSDTAIEFRSASGNLDVLGLQNKIKAKSASGNILLSEVSGRISLHTASGSIEVRTSKGDIEAYSASGCITLENTDGKDVVCKSASGKIRLRGVKGTINVSCASGDISAESLSLADNSRFKTASGDVEVTLSAPLKSDITLASASGNATLNFNGQPMNGRFEVSARKGRSIIAPFTFDTEEEIEKHRQISITKTAVRQGSSPKIVIKTASGKAEVKR